MDFVQNDNLTQFLAFISTVKKEIPEWKLINISLAKETPGNIFYVAKKLHDVLEGKQGHTVACNTRELLSMVKVGKDANLNALQMSILQAFPGYGCSVEIVEAADDGLQKIELRLRREKGVPLRPVHAAAERQARQGNVIMIADDDMFMRSLAKRALESHGEVVAFEDGAGVVDTYMQLLPDILYLDIHMPGRSGIDILNEILIFDPDAYVAMLSADSAKDNVINTKKIGAKTFVTKPFTKEKLEEVLWKCPTIKRKDA
jgi:two-component system chemotaxis response regulator CheY